MKKYEIEIKAYCNDEEAVREKLAAAGAAFVRSDIESDIYFNHPSRDFRITDEALRIRTVKDKTVLTYKGPKISDFSKARVEKETDLGDGDEIKAILDFLGFRASGSVIKKRDYYLLNDMTICLDNVERLGFFVEIEKKGDSVEAVEKELYSAAEILGLEKFERRSYLELIYFSDGSFECKSDCL